MKDKLKKIFAAFAMFFMVVTLVAGCGDKEITSLTVKEGTLEYVYMQNSDVSGAFDNIKVIVKYNDDSKEEVGKDKLTISEFSSAVVGTFKVTITYGDKTTEVNLKVTNNEDEAYEIMGVQNPESIVLRNSNISEKENKEIEFKVRNEVYVVGDDNDFVYFPKITALDENDEMIVINAYKSVTKVYVKDTLEGTYTLLNDTEVATYVEIDDRNSTYDFVDGVATNKYFKLEVRPYYLTEEQLLSENVGDYTSTIEFKVVDAYNVIDEKQLVVMTNHARDEEVQTVADADSFLTTNGITKPSNVNGIVLHNNLVVEQNDLPANYFETVGGQVYLKDYVDLYSHKVATGETFNFYGNYYTVDFSNMPKSNHDAGETSHTTAFRFTSDAGVDATTPNTAKSYLYNTAFVGNANRSENEATTAGISGLILLKAENHTVKVENCLMRTFFLHLMTDNWNKTVMNINNVKSYDSYQNSLFVWGGTVNITNSEFKRAGGPLMILQHRDVDEYGSDDAENAIIDSYAPEVFVDSNTTLESFVTGYESWFATMGATDTATQLAALAGTFTGTGKTYAKVVQDAGGNPRNAINLIAVNMAAGENFESVVGGSSKAKGSVKVGVEFDANGNVVANTGEYIINKYPVGMETLTAGVENAIEFTVATTIYAMLDQMPGGSGIKATLETAFGINSAETLMAAMNNPQIAGLIEDNAELLYSQYTTNLAEQLENVPVIMASAPVFQSEAQGFGFIMSQEVDEQVLYSLVPSGTDLFQGDYIGVYFLGMGITLGYYDTAAN